MTKKPLPILRTDEEAEEFVANSDLSEYDLSNFKRVRYTFEERSLASVSLPAPLVEAAMEAASREGLTFHDFVRRAVEKAVEERQAALSEHPA